MTYMNQDAIQSLYYLADLAGQLAVDLENDGPQVRLGWDHLHALLYALRALAGQELPGCQP